MKPTLLPDDSAFGIDIDALAGAIRIDVLRAAAETLVLAIDWCEERASGDDGLSQMQKITVAQAALESFQGIEQTILAELERTIPTAYHWQPKSRG